MVITDRDEMLNSGVVEQLLQRKTSTGSVMARLGGMLLSIISVLALFIIPLFGIFIMVLFGYITFKIWQFTDVEYEYTFFQGEMQIDRVRGRKRRKNICVFNMEQTEYVVPSDDARAGEFDNQLKRTMKLASGFAGRKTYVAIVRGTAGITKVVFEPNEKLINAMYISKPSKVVISIT